MQDVVNQIAANPLFSLVLALVAFLLIFFILKTLFRITLFLVAVVALYAGYVYFFEEKFPLPSISVDPQTIHQISEKITGLIPSDLNFSGSVDSNFTRPAHKE
jgi:hypothetical protein